MSRLTVHLHNDSLSDQVGVFNAKILIKVREYLQNRWPKITAVIEPWRPEQRNKDIETMAEELALAWAKTKISDPRRPWEPRDPLPMEIAFEKNRVMGKNNSFGMLYDGIHLLRQYWKMLPVDERSIEHLHIVFTNQLIATWDEAGGRYHAHVALFAVPCFISVSGIIEAPARPREYYWIKNSGFGGLANGIADRYLEDNTAKVVKHGDNRLPEIAKGYAVQAVMYHLKGKPFCDVPHCRLYDARWQEEVIRAQIGGDAEFCQKHETILTKLVGEENESRP